jgi:hypothetical protein
VHWLSWTLVVAAVWVGVAAVMAACYWLVATIAEKVDEMNSSIYDDEDWTY